MTTTSIGPGATATRGRMRAVAYEIEVSPRARDHMKGLRAHQRAIVVEAMKRRLLHEPAGQTRQRKRMKADRLGYVAPWERRVGDLQGALKFGRLRGGCGSWLLASRTATGPSSVGKTKLCGSDGSPRALLLVDETGAVVPDPDVRLARLVMSVR